MRKRILSGILTVCMMLSLLPMAAAAASSTEGRQSALNFFCGINSIITKNGDLYVYGMPSEKPTIILNDVKKASTGYLQMAAIKENGDLYAWGPSFGNINEYTGQLGNATKILSHVTDVCLGDAHGGAITEDGSLYMWGGNSCGQVGTGTTQYQYTPVKVLSDVVSISITPMGAYSAAITKDGSLYMWGCNDSGQVGNGSTKNQLTPTKILSNVACVSLGDDHNSAITKNGDLYMWGDNFLGQIGNGSTKSQLTPTKILSNIAYVDLGTQCSAAITKDGDLYTWGCNTFGQVGNGTTKDQLTPTKILSNISYVDSGGVYNAAITKSGDLYMWGGNFSGHIGNGTTTSQLVPLKIMSDVVDVCCDELVGAIKSNGDLYTWGNPKGLYEDNTLSLTPKKTLSNVRLPSGNLPAVNNEIKVILNGKEIEFDQPPIIVNNRVMVPIRAVAEAMGDEVKWNGKLNSAMVIHSDRIVEIQTNDTKIEIYRDPTDIKTWSFYTCDVPAQIIGNRTLTPVRAIAECLGANVSWDGSTRTVIIEYDVPAKKTLSDGAFTQINAYYAAMYANLLETSFSKYTTTINAFYQNRDNSWDSYVIWWDDWTLPLSIWNENEETNVYILKQCFADILSSLPENDFYSLKTESEILSWLTEMVSYGSYLDFAKVGQAMNMSVQTASALSKFSDIAGDAGILIQLNGAFLEGVCHLLTDYTTAVTYIDTLRDTLKETGVNARVLDKALDSLEEDYTNKLSSALAKTANSGGIIAAKSLAGYATGGLFSFAEFLSDGGNFLAGNDDKAAAMRVINCVDLFNKQIDQAYEYKRKEVTSGLQVQNLDEFILLFNLQKAVKTNLYQAMDELRNKKDEYTKNVIHTELKEIQSMTYITWN